MIVVCAAILATPFAQMLEGVISSPVFHFRNQHLPRYEPPSQCRLAIQKNRDREVKAFHHLGLHRSYFIQMLYLAAGPA